MNTLYPIFLKLEGKPVVVIGGGKTAEQKVKGLLEANARITVIAPDLTDLLESLLRDNRISVRRRAYRKGDGKGYHLVFAATNDPAVHRQIYDDAVSRNIPVNIVDVPDLCTYYLASVFHSGDLKVAVSTNGMSPALGKIIRDRIAGEFGKGYPALLETLGEIRPSVHSIYSDPEKRRTVLETIVDNELRRTFPLREKRENNSTNAASAPAPELPNGGKRPTAGKVVLVGAGPGDPELITVKGLRAIQSADVIAYDALVSPGLLSSAPADCEKIFVGKRSGVHCIPQEEINTIIVRKAAEGKNVVRLKGGDPLVFGRGGEEIQALREEGMEPEVIPGITAGTGIPSAAGIPLTHRGAASSVAFVTGSEISGKVNGIDWKSIAAIDTIVVYMGIKNIREVSERLLAAGLRPETPAAAVFAGTLPQQIVINGSLHDIAGKVERADTVSPGIIIIGNAVNAAVAAQPTAAFRTPAAAAAP